MADVQKIKALVDEKADKFVNVANQVWSTPELGFKEEKSAAALIAALESEGFKVTTGLAGIPTAFVGVWGEGHPAIALLGEFDALPSLSQEAGNDVHTPICEGGNGHGCGHNLLGAGSLAAAVAVKDYMEQNGIKGSVHYFGCPGEEFGCGKMFMARAGAFDGIDAAFTWHPINLNSVWGVSSLANNSIYYKFKGRTSHAAASPHLGRSALDACELMSVGCNYLREHIIPEARLHYAYRDVGGSAPNVVQDHACVNYFIRAPKITQVLELIERVNDVARGAALMTGTELEIQTAAGLCDYQPNDVLSQLLCDCLMETGAPEFDQADYDLARKFWDDYSDAEIESSLANIKGVAPDEVYEEVRKSPLTEYIAPYKHIDYAMPGSTDVGDVSYCTPTAQLGTCCWANGTPGHTWQVAAQDGCSIGHKGMIAASKALALAVIRTMEDPELLKKAHEEYVKTTGGKYICPVPPETVPLFD